MELIKQATHLEEDEKNSFGQADLPSGQHSHGDRRVDVTPRHVADRPDDGRHAQAETQGDLHHGGGGVLLSSQVDARAAPHHGQ